MKEEMYFRAMVCGAVLQPFFSALRTHEEDENLGEIIQHVTERRAHLAYSEDELTEIQQGFLLMGGDADSIAVERTRLYRGVDAQGPIPPYEAEWLGSRKPAAQVMGKLQAQYAQTGLAVRAQDRCDYLGIELAYYQRLLLGQLTIEQEGQSAQVQQVGEWQRRFLDEHLLVWVDRYADYALKETRVECFRGHLRCLKAFLSGERRIQGALHV